MLTLWSINYCFVILDGASFLFTPLPKTNTSNPSLLILYKPMANGMTSSQKELNPNDKNLIPWRQSVHLPRSLSSFHHPLTSPSSFPTPTYTTTVWKLRNYLVDKGTKHRRIRVITATLHLHLYYSFYPFPNVIDWAPNPPNSQQMPKSSHRIKRSPLSECLHNNPLSAI